MYIGDFHIHRVVNAKQKRAFVEFPYELYKGDPNWHPPLRMDRFAHQNPKKNPTLKFIEKRRFLATRNGKPIGRIAAMLNHAHQKEHGDQAGHFGFFDCVNEPEVGAALLHIAEKRLIDKGAKKIIGPTEWSVNDQCGLLVDGYDTPNVILMNHGRPYYQEMVEKAGFKKAVDMLAYQADLSEKHEPMALKMLSYAQNNPDIKIRPLSKYRIRPDIHVAMDIFNDAWSENWGFIPFSNDEIDHMVHAMKPVLTPDRFLFGLIKDEPVAFVCMIPDVNVATRDLDGELLPFGWAKLLYRLKSKKINQSRIPLMGIRKSYQNTRLGLALVAYLCEQIFENGRDNHNYTHCELSWVLEGNKSMRRIAEQAKAVPYKTYRMYEKDVA